MQDKKRHVPVRRYVELRHENGGDTLVRRISLAQAFIAMFFAGVTIIATGAAIAWRFALPELHKEIHSIDSPLREAVTKIQTEHAQFVPRDQLQRDLDSLRKDYDQHNEDVMRALGRVEHQLDQVIERQTRGGR